MTPPPVCPFPALLPTWPRVGAWTAQRPLGGGGMGRVYAAHGPGADGPVALKLIDAAQSATARARLLQEARAAAAVRHPHLVRCLDIGEACDVPYLVMEIVSGGSAEDLLPAGPAPEAELVALARGIGSALAALHAASIVHRDIKPANILRDPARGWLLADFGLARIEDGLPGLTRAGNIVGTPDYMGPEQATAEGVDGRADLYSLGATLYHLATGSLPHDGRDVWELLGRVINDPFPDPLLLRPALSPHLAAVIRKLGAKRAEQRYLAAQHLLDDLDLVAAGRPPVHARYRSERDLLAAAVAAPLALLVDDDPLTRRLFGAVLARRGWRVEAAEDAARGLDAAERADIAVVDLGLPDGDGAGLVERMLARRPGLPVVVMTNARIPAQLAAARAAGACEVLEKAATSPSQLAAVLGRALGREPATPEAAPDAGAGVQSSVDAGLTRLTLLAERLHGGDEPDGILAGIADGARGLALAAADLERPQGAGLASAIEALARQLAEAPARRRASGCATLQRAIAALRAPLLGAADAPAAPRALVVDDDPVARVIAGRALAKVGIASAAASGPAEALARLREEPCDLLLSDVVMDGIGGFQFAAQARGVPGCERLPVIFVTALEDFARFFLANPAAGCDLACKPYPLIELGAKALTLLAARRAAERAG